MYRIHQMKNALKQIWSPICWRDTMKGNGVSWKPLQLTLSVLADFLDGTHYCKRLLVLQMYPKMGVLCPLHEAEHPTKEHDYHHGRSLIWHWLFLCPWYFFCENVCPYDKHDELKGAFIRVKIDFRHISRKNIKLLVDRNVVPFNRADRN